LIKLKTAKSWIVDENEKKICSCNVSLNQPSIVLKHEGSNWHPYLEKKKNTFYSYFLINSTYYFGKIKKKPENAWLI